MFNGNDLPYELLLTARQKKLRNAFNNNVSTDLKLAKAQISKIIQSGGFGPLMQVAISLAKKCFNTIRSYSCCFSNGCRNLKKKYMVLEQQL